MNSRYLALFGLLHGLAEYSDIPQFLGWQPAWIYDIIKLFLISSSFAALLAFGLNVYFWFLVFIGLDIVSGDGTGIKYSAFDLAQRYRLGFLGAAVTSYAFFDLSGKINAIAGEKAGKRFIYFTGF